jgi:type I restriction enzyme, R subunit
MHGIGATRESGVTGAVPEGHMLSVNFEFLRAARPDLAALGGFAEHYAFNDPASSLAKLRLFAERVAESVYSAFRLPRPYQPNLIDLLNEESFRRVVPAVVQTKLHALRTHGNRAVHANQGNTSTALAMAREAFDIGCWAWLTMDNGLRTKLTAFTQPKPPADAGKLEKDRSRLTQQLAEREAQMQALLADLEKAKAAQTQAEITAAELQALAAKAAASANELHFDEATTRRRLIDAQLIDVRWKVGHSGQSSEQVGQEIELPQPQNETGIGYADYVLWDDNGKPLAVIEAKKTAKDAEAGRTQAKLYADSLEKVHGRRPVIFYTNGFDIWLWDDAQNHTPRRLYGFYSKSSLQYLIFQRSEKLPLDSIPAKPEIAGRLYQLETISRVCERFTHGYRKSLIVLATGTGKTRVAVSLCDVLSRARWAKHILFLCDRRELRKQADNVFKEFMPSAPRLIMDSDTVGEDTARVYLATYPAMMRQFQLFDVGFFDLIIADESHRSVYNRYRDLFLYFDALQVGLTATPVEFIARNTFKLFGCDDGDPTASFSYQDAVSHRPPYLVPFEVYTHTTEFLRKGIKYQQLTAEQRQQLEEDEADAQAFDFDAEDVDRQVFNKDTNRAILRNLMENGIREATGAHPGKSIIFARSHNHAIVLSQLFDELYPQYGGAFCRVIDNYDMRAEQLIDDFKDPKNSLTIAISVDMLDTGIDVPEVVNLVFAKPVKSLVKFWQMIGRGTRLCPNLLGPGRDKAAFRIFDHWGNFKYFEESYQEAQPSQSKSLLQKLFESRIDLAETALAKGDATTFDSSVELIRQDLAALPENTISVKEKWREVREVLRGETLKSFAVATRLTLTKDLAPLMQWRDTRGAEDSYALDLLITRMQSEHLRQSAVFQDFKDELIQAVSELPVNVNAVREKLDLINRIKSGAFWQAVNSSELETVRAELRGIMRHRIKMQRPGTKPRIIDLEENAERIEFARHHPKLEGAQLAAYRHRVEEVLRGLFESNPTLRKIRRNEPVSAKELDALVGLVLTQHPDVNLSILTEFYPDAAGDLAVALRGIVGLDGEIVSDLFASFVSQHPALNPKQQRFLALLQSHIAQFGAISVEKLYDAPFTQLDINGLDGVFDDQTAEELVNLIRPLQPAAERPEPKH